MVARLLAILLCAGALTPIPGADPNPARTADLGPLRLENGDTLAQCKISYRTYGALNASGSNAVLFPTWFSGRSEELAANIGPGKMVDTTKFHVIAVDALGNGASSSPSNTPGRFPRITIRDMVNSQHLLLTRHLKIRHLHAVIGISMGGMQTFQWIVEHPGFMTLAVPIIGSPRLTAADLLLWQAELSAIESAANCKCDPRSAMEAVNAMHQFALYTPEYRALNTRPEGWGALKSSLAEVKMDPRDWAAQLKAMMAQDVGRSAGGSLDEAAKAVKAKVLVVVARQDNMVNPLPATRFADRINARTLELTGNCGHMATSCEAGVMTPVVRDFLGSSY